jgi:hypothetical protein
MGTYSKKTKVLLREANALYFGQAVDIDAHTTQSLLALGYHMLLSLS